MKMSLRRRSKRRRRIGVVFLTAVFLILLVYFGILQSAVRFVALPFLYVGDTAKSAVEIVRTSFIPDSVLLEENRILQERIDTLERQIAFQDSEELFSDEELISAKVLIRPSQNLYGSLLIYTQDQAEVAEGGVVVTGEGAFVGVVDTISGRLVKVTLSSHPGFSQDLSNERSGIPVTIVGVGGGNMKAELPQGADIERFDVLTDLSTGRVVAEVGEVVVDEASAFTTAYMRMPVNIFEITEVFIVPRVIE